MSSHGKTKRKRPRWPREGIRPTFRIYADDGMAAEIVRYAAEIWRAFQGDASRVRAAESAARRIERWRLGQRVRATRRPPKA